jgi:viroplasmin and RNaseH domain-containing protein
MGFSKRFVSSETIHKTLKSGDSLKKLFSADSILFMDNKATEIYKLFEQGLSEDKIKLLIDEKHSSN